MAETGKKGQDRVTAPVSEQGAQDPADTRTSSMDAATANAPRESDRASHLVKTAWPVTRFAVEDVPTIEASGTKLTKTQLEKVEKEAKASGVSLNVEEVK